MVQLDPRSGPVRSLASGLPPEAIDERTAAAALAVLAGVVVYAVAVLVFPHHSINHDEGVYLQQAEMLIAGRLTLTPPVEEVFRPWFFVAEGGRLYPKYAPIPAAIFVLGELVGRPRLALAGVATGICYLTWAVTAEVFDARIGLLASTYLLASPMFVIDAALFLPYAPTTLLNLVFALGYLRADRTRDRRWSGVAGAALGLAAFARPYTAVLFALPFVLHAFWRLRDLDSDVLVRNLLVGCGGAGGVALALGYNAMMTGSPMVFPYEAFAPRDGLGFGRRAILGYERTYSPSLALRANATVLSSGVSRWIVAGPVGGALAGVGLATFLWRGGYRVLSWGPTTEEPTAESGDRLARRAILAGLIVSVAAGNVLFWGNLNILGSLAAPNDGLIRYFGPYYHFDLLVPVAVFAATGTTVMAGGVRRAVRGTLDRPRAGPVALAVLVFGGTMVAGVAGAALAPPLADNYRNSQQLDAAYQPVPDGGPDDTVVFLPTPLGPWLNHPFQRLRNDPNFDGRTIYAIDERPFAVAAAYPDRRYYRYVYRGTWAPTVGRPVEARLQPLRHIAGERVELTSVVGLPPGVNTSIRLAAGGDPAYYTVQDRPDELATTLIVADGVARLDGSTLTVVSGTNGSVPVEGEVVRVTIFADYGHGSAVRYGFTLPISRDGDTIQAMTPRIEVCRGARQCRGSAGYIPRTADSDVFVRTRLTGDGWSNR